MKILSEVSPNHIPKRPFVGYTLQASKWQRAPLLVEVSEMASLIASLGDFWIVRGSGVIKYGEEFIDPNLFLEVYSEYILSLKEGKVSQDQRIRPFFSSVWTADLDALYSVPVDEHHLLIKVDRPVIQLQTHRFDYFPLDDKFRSMVLGEEAIYWGVQFSFPYLYQDENCEIFALKGNETLPNLLLFKKLQQWMREHTSPTPFQVGEKKVNVPIRLGKKCFEWINHHPQLAKKGLRVLC